MVVASAQAAGASTHKDTGDGCRNCSIKNPLIEQRADPWCMRHMDGNYYFTATVPEYDRIELRCASTVVGLRSAKPKVIWHKHKRGPMSHHIWAPEIHYVDGTWYVDIEGDPLRNPDRHARVQRLCWKQDGTPDFGEPVPDGPLPNECPEKEKNQ